MAISATFTADFTAWNNALKNAQANLKTFEVSTKGVQQSLQRMASGFDGTKIMREAKTVVAAVQAIGGAAKLTEAEQRKVNATVTEAIAKYKALGQVAPKEMLALANATKQVVAPTAAAASSVDSLLVKYVSIGAAIGLAKTAIGGLIDFLSSSVTSYAQAEAAQNRMVAALRAQGTATPSVIKQYAELAATIQRTTAFSDDAANEMQALFVSIGNVGPAQMEKATTAATDLSAGLGIELTQAATLVSKALAGNTGALSRYGIKIDEAKVAAEGASAVFAAVNDRFGGQAAAQLDTYAGKLAQLANNWDNVKEAVGRFLVTNEIAVFAMNRLADAMGDVSDKSETAGTSVAEFYAMLPTRDTTGALAIAFLEDYLALLNSIDRMARGIKSPTLPQAQPLPNLTGEGLIEWERQNAALDEAKKKAEAAAKAIADLRKEITGAKMLTGIKQMAAAWAGLTKSQKESAPAVAALAKFYDALGPDMAELPPELRAIVKEGEAASRAVGALAEEYQSVREEVSKLDLILDKLEMAADAEEAKQVLQEFGFELSQVERRVEEAFDWQEEVDAAIADIRRVDNEIQEMFEEAEANEVNRSLEEFRAGLGRLVSELDALGQSATGTFGKIVRGFAEAAAELSHLIDLMEDFREATTKVGKAMAGLNIGLAFINIVQRIGNAFDEAEIEKKVKATVKTWREWGIVISDTQARINMSTPNAYLTQFAESVESGGGVTIDTLDAISKRFNEIVQESVEFKRAMEASIAAGGNVAVPRGGGEFQNIQQLAAEIEEIFPEMARVVNESGKLATAGMVGVIKGARELGIESKAIADFVAAETSRAISGLTTFLDNAAVTSQASAQAIGASLFSAFAGLQEGGASPLEALEQLTPVIQKLDTQLAETGFAGGKAFDTLRQWAGLASDAVAGPLISAIDGLNDVFSGLHNAGLLNQETFAGLAQQVGETYEQLVLAGQGGGQALGLIAPTLQTLYELQTDFGYSVDATTQQLIDEAKAAGLVGDEHRSAQEQMAIAMDRTADAVEYLAEQFGYVAEEAKKSADAINKIPENVDIAVNYDAATLPDAGAAPSSDGAPGGREQPLADVKRGLDDLATYAHDTFIRIGENAGTVPQELLDALETATPEMRAEIDAWIAEIERFQHESGDRMEAFAGETADTFAGLPADINRGCWGPILRDGELVFGGIEDAAGDSSDGVVGEFKDAAGRVRDALIGLGRNVPTVHIPVEYDRPDRERILSGQGYAKGGVVYAQQGMFVPRGTDTVPAMLTPGEVVLPRDVVSALRSSATAPAVTVHLTIQTLDGADVDRVVRSPEFRRALTSAIGGNSPSGFRTDMRDAMGVR